MSTTVSPSGSNTNLYNYGENYPNYEDRFSQPNIAVDVAARALLSMKKRERDESENDITDVQAHPIFYVELPRDYEGFATLNYPDVSVYTGSWKAGMRDGRGAWKNQLGSYDGQWKEDQPHGQGRLVFENGDYYEGTFANGEYQGQGKFVFANGITYLGELDRGMRHGQGRLFRANEFFYEGTWVNDALQEQDKMMICSDFQMLKETFPNMRF